MGRKNRSTKIDDPGQAAGFLVNPFAALAVSVPPGQASAPNAPAAAAAPGAAPDAAVSTRVRLAALRFAVERKGHGGKTVTLVHGLGHLTAAEQAELLQAAKQALGVGGAFEAGVLQLQGDQRERARVWFERR